MPRCTDAKSSSSVLLPLARLDAAPPPNPISIAGPPDLFERVFGGRLLAEEREVIKPGSVRTTGTFIDWEGAPVPGLVNAAGSQLAEVVTAVAIEEPYYPAAGPGPAEPAADPPEVGYWHLTLPDQLATALRADAAHRDRLSGAGVRVAMVDTGFQHHPFFTTRGYRVEPTVLGPGTAEPEVDENGHGTGEAANVFAAAPGATLLPVKAATAAGALVNVTAAFTAAAALQPQVITNSWGSSQPDPPLSAANQALAAEVESLVAQRRPGEVRRRLEDLPAPDVAEVFRHMSRETEAVAFRLLPRALARSAFEYLDLDDQELLLRGLGEREVAAILNEMSPDDRTALLEELPGSVTRRLLNLLDDDERHVATELLGYPEESIGRLMTPDYVAVKPHWTVSQALEHVRVYGSDSETLNVVYVVGENGVLIDDLRMRELLLVDPETRIEELMDERFVSLVAAEDQEVAVGEFIKHDRSALPVTDTDGVLVGIVMVATVLLWHRSRSMPGARRRRPAVVSGWGDLFRLVASVARGVLWLIAVLLLLGRIVFWPSGRRW